MDRASKRHAGRTRENPKRETYIGQSIHLRTALEEKPKVVVQLKASSFDEGREAGLRQEQKEKHPPTQREKNIPSFVLMSWPVEGGGDQKYA